MKNIKLGSKIGASFGVVILITLALGALAVFNMLNVGGESDKLAKQYLPEVRVANAIERHALMAMFAIRGFSLSEDLAYLKEGREELAQLRKELGRAKDLANQYEALVTLRKNISQAMEAVDRYELLVNQAEEKAKALGAARATMDQAAASYIKNCVDFLAGQNQAMENEMQANAGAARLGERLAKITLVNDVIDLGNEMRVANFKSQALRDFSLIRQALPDFAKIEQKLADLRRITRQKVNLDQLESIKNSAESYKSAIQTLLAGIDAMHALQKEREDLGDKVLAIAKATAAAGLGQTQKIADEAARNLGLATIVTLIGLLVALAAGAILAVLTTRNVTRPVLAAADAVSLASQGDFRIQMEDKYVKRGDELGAMSRDVQKMADNLSATVREVAQASDMVAASANEISQGNQDLSQRTQQQASAIEETASAIEEMTSSVKQNAENSRQANNLAKRTAEMAKEGGRVVENTVEAMAAVTESSKKISDIINVVNEIAFQTNLLALNAAVEAARAGEAGRGFAVVAGEVRNLAGRSASAAKEIQGLITDSVNKVEQGNELVGESGRLLGEIITNVQAVADTVAEITASSQEQAQGIDEINKAVTQMDEGVQQNAALVEEAASSSEQMASAAEELRSQMGQFKVDGRQAGPVASLPGPAPRPAAKPAAKPLARKPAAKPPAPKAEKPAAKPKKQSEDEFFNVDDLEGFEEF